jgi:hypothetical protein
MGETDTWVARYLQAGDGETASVRTWLEGVHIADGQSSPVEGFEAVPQRREKSVPCTPLRRPNLQDHYAELSPTDTAFSQDSIFDAFRCTPSSPTSPVPGGRKVQYAETDASSVCSEKDDVCLTDTVTHKYPYLPTPPASVHSYEPPTDEEDALEPNPPDLLIPDSKLIPPDTPRIHHLVSCLQCVLAGLPCTRRTPACSRCERNGHGEMCLLQRRRMRKEMSNGQGNFNRMPVLLKLWGCDEALHERKVALAEEVGFHSRHCQCTCANNSNSSFKLGLHAKSARIGPCR